MDYTQSIYSDRNSVLYEGLIKWAAICGDLYVWSYSTNFKEYLIPYDTFGSMQDFYQFLSTINIKYLYNMGQFNQKTPTGWSLLKAYLQAKLAWDANYDINELTNDFFNAMYGDAAQNMLNFYSSYRMHSANMLNGEYNNDLSSIYGGSCKAQYWPLATINQWLAYIDDALSDIEYLRETDLESYQMYYDNIVTERVSLYYMIISLYPFSTDEYDAIVDAFIEDVQRLNINYLNEMTTMATFINSITQ